MLTRITDWFCTKVWPHVDSQSQIFDIQLDITNTCNLRCIHCYQDEHLNKGTLNLDQWMRVLDQYEALVKKLRMLPRIILCGGEPFACKYLTELIIDIRRRFADCDLFIPTNGTLFNSDITNMLKKYNVEVQISLDGPDAARNDTIRGKGSFDRAVAGCQQLALAGVIFRHLTVLSKRTSAWIPDFFKLPLLTGAGAINFTRFIVEGQARNLVESNGDRPLVGMELQRAMREILECSIKSNVRTSTDGALWHLIDNHLGAGSNVGFNGLVVDHRGQFKVTSRVAMTLGNVLDEGIEHIFFNHPVMRRLRSGDILGCQQCPHFKKCRGDRNASFAEYGHFFGPDPGCWLPYAKTHEARVSI